MRSPFLLNGKSESSKALPKEMVFSSESQLGLELYRARRDHLSFGWHCRPDFDVGDELQLCESCHGQGRGSRRDEMRIFRSGGYDRRLQEGQGQKGLDKIADLCYVYYRLPCVSGETRKAIFIGKRSGTWKSTQAPENESSR